MPDADPDYVAVRRRATDPFRVLLEDLEAANPTGYDLEMVRSLTVEGLTTPLVVRPLPGGRFRVIDGLKRLAAIMVLIRADKPIYDVRRHILRPASRIFAMLRCRVQPSSREK